MGPQLGAVVFEAAIRSAVILALVVLGMGVAEPTAMVDEGARFLHAAEVGDVGTVRQLLPRIPTHRTLEVDTCSPNWPCLLASIIYYLGM